MLARAAHTQPSALNLLRDALAADLEHLAVPALSVAVETNPVLGELLSKALQSDQISAGTLEQIANTALYPSFVLAESAVVLKRLADNSANDGERAGRLLGLSSWLSDLGQLEEALATTEQAVHLYRQLAEDRPDAFLSSLARSLNNLSAHLTSLWRPLEALATMEEASSIYRQLAEADPDAFRLDLAMSLNNQSENLAAMGRREEALATSEQAVTICRQLAKVRPDAFLSDLAGSLSDMAKCQGNLERWEEALATIEEAVSPTGT